MRALLYCRQSDSSGAGAESLSIESMETELRRWCAAEGWAPVGVVREPDRKGWQDETERPGLAEALDLARAGAYDLLLVWDMSRFARNVRIQETLVWRFAALGVEVRSRTEPHANQSPMIRQILGAVAEERTREISKHIKRALGEKTRQGRWHGPTPYGYERGADGRLAPVEDERPVVREIMERGAAGESWWRIAHDLNARGVRLRGAPWSHRTTRGTAVNPVHIGVCRAGAERVEGAHAPTVDRALWERCQDRIRARRRAQRPDARQTFLAGRAYCGCGLPLYAVTQRNQRHASGAPRNDITVLRCRSIGGHIPNCGQPKRAISLRIAEAFAAERLAADLAAAVPWRAALAEAAAAQKRAAPAVVSERDRLARARARLEARRARLLDGWEEGLITKADLAARLAPVDAELAAVAARLAEAPPPPDPAAFREAGAIVAAMRDAPGQAPPAELAGVLAALRATLHLEDGALRLRYGEPFGRMLGG